MAIRPCGHRILVKPDPIETTTSGGIVIVMDEKLAAADQMVGTLVSVGDQAWKAFSKDYNGEPWAKVGDRVLYARYAGKVVEDPESGEDFVILNDEDCVAVLTN
jgi:co-chaperonin GroES (HSP10)